MCGIIGYLGSQEAGPILLDGLRRLEYRGYDSAGLAILEPGMDGTSVTKSEGKVQALADELLPAMPAGRVGIGHTRWATHGRPTVRNAHPHGDCGNRIFAVHNGIIENFAELRAELQAAGHTFVSETDSEVIPHLVEEELGGAGATIPAERFVEAVRAALRRLDGAYAMVLVSRDQPDLLIGARLNAPLLVGLGEEEWFLASDPTALIAHTREVVALRDGEMAVLTSSGPRVESVATGAAVEPDTLTVDWDHAQAEKQGYPHYMLKEIHEIPESVGNVLRGRVGAGAEPPIDDLGLTDEQLRGIQSVRLLGMGTSLHAAMVGEYLLEDWASVRARAEDASEFRYRRSPSEENVLAVILTQSGETADTIAGMRKARTGGAIAVAITNVVGSTAAREADAALYLRAGPEIGVASTKTFVAHLVSQALLAARLAAVRGGLEPARMRAINADLRALPARISEVLDLSDTIAALARRYSRYRNFMYVGRGLGLPVALEGALKLKEISYLHAEGISAGDLKHGPIALLDPEFPVVAVCTDLAVAAKMASNVHEVAARQAPVLALVAEGDRSLEGVVTDLLELPAGDDVSLAVVASVAMQLFAYHVATELGESIDQPRNLAKSVTVE